MREALILISVILFSESLTAFAQTNSWNGLTPLKSTRSDVEKLLGPSIKREYEGAYVYKTQDGSIDVYYSTKDCDDGWKVSKDAVLSIRVYPKTNIDQSAGELGLDRHQFLVTVDDALFATWTDPIAGRSYYFGGVDRQFIHMDFIPKREQNNIRCNGWPPFQPEGVHYPFDRGSLSVPKGKTFDLNRAASLISNFVVQISRNGEKYQGYVLVYFDRTLPLKEYRRRVTLMRKIAFTYFKVPNNKLTFLEGGLRSQPDVELYLLPRDVPPPAPAPTLPSPQFMRRTPN